MTNDQIREELDAIRSGFYESRGAIARLCGIIEALIDRDDPDVETMMANQRGTPDEEFARGGEAELK